MSDELTKHDINEWVNDLTAAADGAFDARAPRFLSDAKRLIEPYVGELCTGALRQKLQNKIGQLFLYHFCPPIPLPKDFWTDV